MFSVPCSDRRRGRSRENGGAYTCYVSPDFPDRWKRMALLAFAVLFLTCGLFAQSLTSVSGNTVTLNIGRKDGVKVGMTAYVIYEEEVSGQMLPLKIAKIKVTAVKSHSTTATILEQNKDYKLISGLEVQFIDKLSASRENRAETTKARPSKQDRVDTMTLVQKIRYADRKLNIGDYKEAVRVYGILEKEAPDDSLFADNYRLAKQGLERQQAEARRRRAERAELAKIRKNLDYYRLVVEKSRNSDLAKAIRFQKDICRVDRSRKAQDLLKDLEYQQAVQNTYLPSDFEPDAISDIVTQFPERSKPLVEQAESHRSSRLAREEKEKEELEKKVASFLRTGEKINARVILRKLIAKYPQSVTYRQELEKIMPEAGEAMSVTLPGGGQLQLAWIPSGSFMMGSPSSESGRDSDEGPRHSVTISHGFYMGKYEVTQAQWQAIMGNNPSHFKGANLPVETVSWNDVQDFIKRLNQKTGLHFRLPTEAEWEYACRGGTVTAFCYGNSLSADMANFDGYYPYNAGKGTYREKTTPVGSFQPNQWGLYDMHGNVWEWCSDWYDSDYYKNSPSTDPTGPSSGVVRVDRGGSWINYAQVCRSATRDRDVPSYRSNLLGFRLILADE